MVRAKGHYRYLQFLLHQFDIILGILIKGTKPMECTLCSSRLRIGADKFVNLSLCKGVFYKTHHRPKVGQKESLLSSHEISGWWKSEISKPPGLRLDLTP